MNFDRDDEKMEAQLRQFRPQPPRAFPRHVPFVWLRSSAPLASAAVAVLAVAFFLSKPPVRHNTNITPETQAIDAQAVTWGHLRRFADDPAQLDSHLDSLSSQVLPDVQRKGGVLSKLAQSNQ
ncbi:MAG: hypothetical protein WA738_21180 [Candidatus Angelobacter sp.]